MKDKLISAIKLIVPLGFGVFLIWLFYDALCEDQKKDLFIAFKKSNYFWVVLAFSHVTCMEMAVFIGVDGT